MRFCQVDISIKAPLIANSTVLRDRSRLFFAQAVAESVRCDDEEDFVGRSFVLVDTEAGITGIGQGGSPDTVRNMARSVIGKNAFDTEFIWQHGFMDGFYSPGKGRDRAALHRPD